MMRKSQLALPDSPKRIQKALADAGLGSRRTIELWIQNGRIRVNGVLAQLGMSVTSQDRVTVDGRAVHWQATHATPIRVILYHKPEGEVVTRRDPQDRPTIFRRLPGIREGRWIAVGRLDINTAGLLLLTNHGDLAHALMHPAQCIEREYAVRVHGTVTDALLQRLVNGVTLQDGAARFEEIVESGGSGSNQWFHVVLREGRQHEVRRLWEAVDCKVSRLKRVRFANVILGARPLPGQWRPVIDEELSELIALAGLAPTPVESISSDKTTARTRYPKKKRS
jgi:23S rRNA pseudouridine2605 synthase